MARNAAERVAVALTFVGTGEYELGEGGFDPHAPTPFTKGNLCDCSGFANYVVGEPRGIYNCAAIVGDAEGPHHRYRQVTAGEPVLPGDVIVRKPLPGHAHGHVGVIVCVATDFQAWRHGRPGWGRKLGVVHCSTFPGLPDIRLTDAEVWESVGNAIIVRPVAG